MLRIEAITITKPTGGNFCVQFVVTKKMGNRLVVNLNKSIPNQYFKLEGLFLLKDMLQPGNKMWRIHLTDTLQSLCDYVAGISNFSERVCFMSFATFVSAFFELHVF